LHRAECGDEARDRRVMLPRCKVACRSDVISVAKQFAEKLRPSTSGAKALIRKERLYRSVENAAPPKIRVFQQTVKTTLDFAAYGSRLHDLSSLAGSGAEMPPRQPAGRRRYESGGWGRESLNESPGRGLASPTSVKVTGSLCGVQCIVCVLRISKPNSRQGLRSLGYSFSFAPLGLDPFPSFRRFAAVHRQETTR